MYRWRLVLVWVSVAALCLPALAEVENEIKQHNPDLIRGVHWDLFGDAEIRIFLGLQGETFEFEAVLKDANNPYLGPGRIDYMTAVADAGPVTLTVVGHDGHPWGAYTIGSINLSAAGVDSEITALRTQSSIASLGPILVDRISGSFYVGNLINNDFQMETLAGDIDCLGMRNLTVSASTLGPPYPSITVRDGYGWTIDITGSMHKIGISTALSGTIEIRGAEHDLDELSVGEVLSGTVHVGRDLKQASIGALGAADVGGTLGVDRDLGTPGPPSTGLTLSCCIHGMLNIGRDLIGFAKLNAIYGGASVNVGRDLGVAGYIEGFLQDGMTIAIGGNVPAGAKVWLKGKLAGEFTIGGDMAGLIELWKFQGQDTLGGTLAIGQGLSGTLDIEYPVTGTIQVGGTVAGQLNLAASLSGVIDVAGLLAGGIRINQSFYPAGPNGGRILLGALDAQTSDFVSVDNDGWHLGHEWDPNAYVRIGTQEPYQYFYGNTPDQHLYHITCRRGDCNNDDTINNFDIDPFVLALTNEPGYALAYPGLSSSRWYHTDMNCDGFVNNFDLDVFILRLTDPEEYYRLYGHCELGCGEPGGERGQGGAPEQVAALYQQYVVPERLPHVIDAAEFLATAYKGTQRGKFWTDVHAALVK